MRSVQILDALHRLGAEPTRSLTAFARIEASVRSAASVDAGTALSNFRELLGTSTDGDAIAAALDAAIAAEMRATAARTVVANIDPQLDRGTRRAVKADTAELWAIAADRFDEHTGTLAAAVAIVGADPDKNAVRAMGPAAQAAYDDYQAAARSLGQVLTVVREIAAVNKERTPLPMARFVDPDQLHTVADLDRANSCQGGSAFGLAALVAAGFTLKLTTAAEHAATVERISANEAARQAERGGPLAAADGAEIDQVRRVR